MGRGVPPQSTFCGNLNVWALLKWKEQCYGHETFIDVREDLSVNTSALGLKRIGPGVVEIYGELFPHSIICEI